MRHLVLLTALAIAPSIARASDDAAREHLFVSRDALSQARFSVALAAATAAAGEASSAALIAEIARQKGTIEANLLRRSAAMASFVRALRLEPGISGG